jgi:glucan 1,3-beta-glucosidase
MLIRSWPLLLLMMTMNPEASSQGIDDHPPNSFDIDETIEFSHFTAHPSNQTCSSDVHARPFNNQIRGVNLGGWMVLEPWITPSLFYQFLGGDETNTALDTYSFCQTLGPVEANRQLRRHWETWVTEEIIEELASSDAVNSLRLPVGDFMYVPYGPYSEYFSLPIWNLVLTNRFITFVISVGCFDGALAFIDQLLDWAYANGLTVLIDIHAMKGSQNGFDNSGQAMGFQWTSKLNTEPAGLVTFEHWPIRTAEWMGTFDLESTSYPDINHENIKHSLKVIEKIVETYAGHPAVLGLEPVNEPWQYTPIDQLKKFYWDGYLIMKKHAPYWKYIMHDSFRFDTAIWGGFMSG